MNAVGDVLSGRERYAVACSRAEAFVDALPDGCVNLLVLDPPYYDQNADAAWNAWSSEDAFLVWMGEQCARWRRVLASTGTVYVFASPLVGSRVEVEMRKHFGILASIVWAKPDPKSEINPGGGRTGRSRKESYRTFFQAHERCIMAEHHGAMVRDDAIRAEVFAPLRMYLEAERIRAGLSRPAVDAALGCQMSGHWFTHTQWELPNEGAYERLRTLFGAGFLAREYADMRAEYADLHERWASRRRPFHVTNDVPYTDVWTYPTVQRHDGKHPCEKPPDMARDIIAASSRPGDVVADFFAGSGRFLEWAVKLGRRAIGCDMDPHWATVSAERCAAAAVDAPYRPPPVPDRVKPTKMPPPSPQLGLFSVGAT